MIEDVCLWCFSVDVRWCVANVFLSDSEKHSTQIHLAGMCEPQSHQVLAIACLCAWWRVWYRSCRWVFRWYQLSINASPQTNEPHILQEAGTNFMFKFSSGFLSLSVLNLWVRCSIYDIYASKICARNRLERIPPVLLCLASHTTPYAPEPKGWLVWKS